MQKRMFFCAFGTGRGICVIRETAADLAVRLLAFVRGELFCVELLCSLAFGFCYFKRGSPESG